MKQETSVFKMSCSWTRKTWLLWMKK